MKQMNLFKTLLIAAVSLAANVGTAQIHPLSYGLGSVNTTTNWYGNYVGLRFEVVSPLSDAGNKKYTTTYSGSTPWGGQVTSPIVNKLIQMPQAGDSLCNVGTVDHTITTDMSGKIGFVYRGSSYFGDKAYDCQNAGALACVIVNNVPGPPLGMASAGAGASVTIPVFMISQEDGNIIDSLYNAGVPVSITITNWGEGNQNDLGFVPNGAATWHAYAVPANQLAASGNPVPYNMLDGAFIANFGTNPATNIKLKATTSFTAVGGLPVVQHSDSVIWEGPFYDDTLTAHNTADSIMAFFSSTEYGLSSTGTGEYDVTYTISSDSIDQYPFDNTQTVSFYATDSLYSKGTYDFVNNKPVLGDYYEFGGGIEFLWGPMYYVANGGTAISAVQLSLALTETAGTVLPVGTPLPVGPTVYVFKWVDGSNGQPADSIVQNGELSIVGSGVYQVNGTTDTSEALLYLPIYADTDGSVGSQTPLDANSWYYVCADVPASTGGYNFFLGCDAVSNAYPRIFGRYNADNGMLDYSNILNTTTKDSTLYYYTPDVNYPLAGTQTRNINTVDSFVYGNMIGLMPSIAMIANNHPNAVPVVSKPLANVALFPNPAKDQLNVTASFDQNEKTVTYEIIDGLARFVRKDTHYNVQNDTYTINTASLASGNYFLTITAEGRVITRKFSVVK